MRSIDEIAIECGTDKSSRYHDYCGFYGDILAHLRDKPCRILEVGVQRGYSLLMWERAFPLATVVGVDKVRHKELCTFERAHLFFGDATNGKTLAAAAKHGPFDFIVDDAAHKPEVTQPILDALFLNHLVPGGWHIIEDISLPPRFLDYAKNLVNRISHYGATLHENGRWAWGSSVPEFDRHIHRIVFHPGLVAIQKKP